MTIATTNADEHRPAISVRIRRILPVVAIGLAFALNAAATWQRWGDLVIDTGREFDTPKQLAEGKLLYRDVRYWYGPLAPYTHATLFRIFGPRLEVLTTTGLVLCVLLAWLSYRLLRLFIGRSAATLGTIAVLTINAFGLYRQLNIFNFVLPYSYPAAYGMLAALASTFFLLRHQERGRRRDFLAACAFLGVAALCKLETLAAAVAVHSMFVLLAIRRPRLSLWTYLGGYGAAVAIPVAVYSCFRFQTGPGLWQDNLFLPGNVNASEFVLRHSGLHDPVASLREVCRSLAGLFACFAAGIIGTLLECRVERQRTPDPVDAARQDRSAEPTSEGIQLDLTPVLRGIIATGVSVFVGYVILSRFDTGNILTSLPILLAVSWLILALRWWRAPAASPRTEAFMMLLVFALASLLRLGLRASAEHYGFYLSIPAILALTVIVCGPFPAAVDRRYEGRYWAASAAGWSLLLALITLHALKRRTVSHFLYPQPALQTIHAPRGTIVGVRHYYGVIDQAVEFLGHQPPGTRVAVFPEGCLITFLAGRDNALGIHTLLPLDITGSYDDDGIVRRLASSPPDFILLTTRSLGEYGATLFGEDYARRVAEWIADNYEIVTTYQSRTYGVRILRRLAATPAGRS